MFGDGAVHEEDNEHSENDYVLDNGAQLRRPRITNFRKNHPTCMTSTKIVTIKAPVEKLADQRPSHDALSRNYTNVTNHSHANLGRNKTVNPSNMGIKMPGLGEITNMRAQLNRTHKSIHSPLKIKEANTTSPAKRSSFAPSPATKNISIDIGENNNRVNPSLVSPPRPVSVGQTFQTKVNIPQKLPTTTTDATKDITLKSGAENQPSQIRSSIDRNTQKPTMPSRPISVEPKPITDNIFFKAGAKTNEPAQLTRDKTSNRALPKRPESIATNKNPFPTTTATPAPAAVEKPTAVSPNKKSYLENKTFTKLRDHNTENKDSMQEQLSPVKQAAEQYEKQKKVREVPRRTYEKSRPQYTKTFSYNKNNTTTAVAASTHETTSGGRNSAEKSKKSDQTSQNIAKNIQFFEQTSANLHKEQVGDERRQFSPTKQKTFDSLLNPEEKLAITSRYSPESSQFSAESSNDPLKKSPVRIKRRSASNDLDFVIPSERIRQTLALFGEYDVKNNNSDNASGKIRRNYRRSKGGRPATTYVIGSPPSVKSIATIYMQNAQNSRVFSPSSGERHGVGTRPTANKGNVDSLIKSYNKNF